MLSFLSQSQLLIAVSVLSSSFLGSLHCLGMCGPIVIATNKSKMDSFLYQAGRLLGYLSLGLLVGFLGQEIIGAFPHSLMALMTPFFLGSVFLLMGIMLMKKRKFHLPLPGFISKPLHKFISLRAQNKSRILSSMIGFSSIFLPCGWLYGFVIGAATTESLSTSLLIMFMFWLGTVPALFFTPIIFEKMIRPLKSKVPYLAGGILMSAGLILIVIAIWKIQ